MPRYKRHSGVPDEHRDSETHLFRYFLLISLASAAAIILVSVFCV